MHRKKKCSASAKQCAAAAILMLLLCAGCSSELAEDRGAFGEKGIRIEAEYDSKVQLEPDTAIAAPEQPSAAVAETANAPEQPENAPETEKTLVLIESYSDDPDDDAPISRSAALPARSAAEATTEEETQFTVYTTPTGECYHYDRDCAGKNAIPKTLEEAQRGFRPCKKCAGG